MSDPARPPRRARLRRWAAILLPVVIGGRAILLVFQLRSEHDQRAHANDPPAWPAVAGEELRFRTGDPAIDAWAAQPGNHPLAAAVTEKDDLPQPPDTGCMLSPTAMAQGRGTLTLRSRTSTGDWTVDWSGGRTMPTRDQTGGDEPNAEIRRMEAAMLDAADCGETARLELTEWQVHSLVNLVADQPPPPPDTAPPQRKLVIRPDVPSPVP